MGQFVFGLLSSNPIPIPFYFMSSHLFSCTSPLPLYFIARARTHTHIYTHTISRHLNNKKDFLLSLLNGL